jgi:drug/metabolite transporter (DMT)-like permease
VINLLGRPSAQALFVTFLWSTSWILIKVGLAEIPPLTFAGLRYTFAFLILLPAIKRYRTDFFFLSRVHWFRLILLGLLFYAITQGGQFVTLSYLPATTFNMLLNFTSVFVLVFGAVFLSERPSRFQLLGLMVFLLGIVAYFYPVSGFEGQTMGLVFAGITVRTTDPACARHHCEYGGGCLDPAGSGLDLRGGSRN